MMSELEQAERSIDRLEQRETELMMENDKLRATNGALVAGLVGIIDMIDNCADVPRTPDSIPMMVLAFARATVDAQRNDDET